MFPGPLRRHILLLIAAKAALLTLIYVAFFSGGEGHFTPAQLVSHLVGPNLVSK